MLVPVHVVHTMFVYVNYDISVAQDIGIPVQGR